MKRLLGISLAALITLVGCQNVEQDVPGGASLKTVRFHAVAASTRTAFEEPVNGLYETLWTDNDSDVLLSLNYGKAEKSAITSSADGKTAAFEAAFDASAASAPYTFYAISPASAARAISPSRSAWSVYIAADQTPLPHSVDEAAQLLVAKSAAAPAFPDEVNLHFSHLTAYGRIELQNLGLVDAKVRKVELVFNTPIVGEWYWGEDGTLAANGDSHTIVLHTDASGDLWFACAPVDVSGKTLTVVLFTDQGNLTKTITFPEGRSFASGKVAHFSVDMAGAEMKGDSVVYTLVTSTSQLEEGCEVVILDADEGYAMGPEFSYGGAREAISSGVSLSGSEVAISNAEVAVFVMEAGTVSGTWAFKGEDGYLSAVSVGYDDLVSKETKDAHASWTLSFEEDGSVRPEAAKGKCRLLCFDSFYEEFTCYENEKTPLKLYRRSGFLPVEDDPLMLKTEYGCYLAGAERAYVKGSDQMVRSYPDGKLEFVILNAAEKEQLVISGYDPASAKGDEVTVDLYWRKYKSILQKRTLQLKVVWEDGPKVWLGDGTGQGFIIKK